MKKRLITYLLFLPIIMLVAFTPVAQYLSYLGWIAVVATLALVVFAFIKTKAFYKVKKILLFALIFFAVFGAYQESMADAYNPYKSSNYEPATDGGYYSSFHNGNAVPSSYTQQAKCSDIKNKITELRKVFATVGRIPEAQRTKSQEKDYQKAKAEYEDLMKDCHIQPCPTPKELYEEISADCWACDIANLFIEAGDKVATSVYSVVEKQGYALALLALGFFFWLIVRTLMLFGSFGAGDTGRYFSDLFKKFLLVALIASFLFFPIRNLVDFVMTPFFLFSSTMTQDIQKITTDMPSNTGGAKIDELMSNQFGKALQCQYCEDLKNNKQSLPDPRISQVMKYNASLDERVVSPTIRNSLLCTVCSIYRITVPPTVVGQFLFCSAKQLKTDGKKVNKETVYSDWDGVIVGFILTITFFLMSALFSFYLIDSFFRICIVLVLFPFLVVAFAFQSTRSYTKRGLDVLIHSTATYIVIALFMAMSIQMFYTMLGSVSQDIVTALADEQNAYTLLKDLLAFGSKNGALVMFSCLGLLFIILFMLGHLDLYITGLTGIRLMNGGGAMAAVSAAAPVVAAVGTVSQLYDQEWGDPDGGDSGNTAESKAAKIRSYGEDESDGKSEKAVDSAAKKTEKAVLETGFAVAGGIDKTANGIDEVGTKASKWVMSNGVRMCGACYGLGAIIGVPTIIAGAALWVSKKTTYYVVLSAAKVMAIIAATFAKASRMAVKYAGRGIIKAVKWPVKAIARNKYFNKTVGLFWKVGIDVKNAPANVRNKARAARKYFKGRFGRKK